MQWSLILLYMAPLVAQTAADRACSSCHSVESADFKSHPHFTKGLHCDTCHGASVKHSAQPTAARTDRAIASDRIPALCGACHNKELQQYSESSHGRLVLAGTKYAAPECGTCHGVHRAQTASETQTKCLQCHPALPNFFLNTVPPIAGKIACVDCHSVHSE